MQQLYPGDGIRAPGWRRSRCLRILTNRGGTSPIPNSTQSLCVQWEERRTKRNLINLMNEFFLVHGTTVIKLIDFQKKSGVQSSTGMQCTSGLSWHTPRFWRDGLILASRYGTSGISMNIHLQHCSKSCCWVIFSVYKGASIPGCKLSVYSWAIHRRDQKDNLVAHSRQIKLNLI